MATTANHIQLQYRIGMVARLTGISIHTLRMWERRHAVVVPTRTEGGDRLYTASDVERLRKVAELIKEGHTISRLAPLSDRELSGLATTSVESGPLRIERGDPIESIIDAVRALDHRRAEAILNRSRMDREPHAFVVEIIKPLLATVGERWRSGTIEIYHEHMLSNLVRSILLPLARTTSAADGARRVVIATPQGERHEFGALTLSILAGSLGWNPTYLGVDLPAADIAAAATKVGAEMVLLSMTYQYGPSIQAELSLMERLLDPGIELLIGGAAAAKVDRGRAVLVDTATLTKRLS